MHLSPGGESFGAFDLLYSQKVIVIGHRLEGTGTRLLLDRELEKVGLKGSRIQGHQEEFRSHFDVAMEVFSGRADAALAVKPVACLLGLDFVSVRWERYDLLISKARFYEQGVQLFLGFSKSFNSERLLNSWTAMI